MQTPFDTLFEQAQPDKAEIFATPFLISDRISKRALLLLLRFQKIIICEFAGVFVARERHKNPGFFYFQKGRLPFGALFQPFSYFGRTAFFVFLEHYPVPQKGHWRKWRLIVKNLNNRSSNLNSPQIIQRYMKSSKIKQILRKLAKTAWFYAT